MSPSIQCSACGNKVTTPYCGKCGQKVGNKPISVWHIISDFFSNYLSLERSGLATMLLLIRKPRFVIDNYYLGNKGYYSSPGKLLIFSVVVFALHLALSSKTIFGLTIQVQSLNTEYAYWILLIPVLTIISQLVFVRQGFKPARHLITITYLATTFSILVIVIEDLLQLINPDLVDAKLFVIYLLLVFGWSSWALSKRRSFWMYLLNTLTYVVLFAAILLLIDVLFSQRVP